MASPRQTRPSKPKSQLLVAVLLAVAIGVGVTAVDRLPRIEPGPMVGGGTARSGAWFCPHGGGKGWNVWLSVSNPTEEPVSVRISGSTEEGPVGEPENREVAPGTTVTVRAPGRTRGAGAMVEYFDGFVAAGWVAQAGGGERGVAAEPCTADAGKRILLADATTVQQQDAYVVIMNPFDTPASYSLRLYSEKERPVETPEEVIRPRHTVSVRLSDLLLGEPTLGTEVMAGLGRVTAANLNIEPGDGGVRASVGILAPNDPRPTLTHVMPGGLDTGQSKLVVMNPWKEQARLEARLLTSKDEQTATGLQGVAVQPSAAATWALDTPSPSTISITTLATSVVRRSFGASGDQGATAGAVPATSWVVPPAVTEKEPFEPRLLVANTGTETAEVHLRLLPEEGVRPDKTETTITIPPGTTGFADLPREAPHAAVAITSSMPVVPAFAAYSNDRGGYAVVVGIPWPTDSSGGAS